MVANGTIFDIKRFAVHDGPGIRTTVFLKGCPLRCSWCHNPESQPSGISNFCGRNGNTEVGEHTSADTVVDEIQRDTLFFDESGGGVTFSGGEPLAQPDFLRAMLERCGDLSIHRVVDTSGYTPRDILLAVAEQTDLFLYDIKVLDDALHRQYTGVKLAPILDNLRCLCELAVPLRVRFPVVPGITDTAGNVSALVAFLRSLPRQLPIDVLPYHAAAMDKYRRFGMEPPLPHVKEPTNETMLAIKNRIANI